MKQLDLCKFILHLITTPSSSYQRAYCVSPCSQFKNDNTIVWLNGRDQWEKRLSQLLLTSFSGSNPTQHTTYSDGSAVVDTPNI